jgi:hypothetical protein
MRPTYAKNEIPAPTEWGEVHSAKPLSHP